MPSSRSVQQISGARVSDLVGFGSQRRDLRLQLNGLRVQLLRELLQPLLVFRLRQSSCKATNACGSAAFCVRLGFKPGRLLHFPAHDQG